MKKKIPLIMYGENHAEYNSTISENESPLMKPEFYASTVENQEKIKLSGLTIEELIQAGIPEAELNLYLPVDIERIEKNKTEVHYLSY